MPPSSPEKGLLHQQSSPEKSVHTVVQPVKMEGLGSLLVEINDIVGESAASNPGEQWSGGTHSSATTGSQSGAAGMSARDLALASLPQPAVMQRELAKHIRSEVKQLRKQALSIARAGKPGAAYKLNELYARIRRMNSLLGEILQASYDVLKRMFVRVFVDKQAIM